MPWGNRHYTGTKFKINDWILNNSRRERAVNPLKLDRLAMRIVGIPSIIGVDHDVLIAKFRLWPSRCNHKRPILKIVERGLFFFINDLVIRNCSLTLWIPVNYPVAPIDQ